MLRYHPIGNICVTQPFRTTRQAKKDWIVESVPQSVFFKQDYYKKVRPTLPKAYVVNPVYLECFNLALETQLSLHRFPHIANKSPARNH